MVGVSEYITKLSGYEQYSFTWEEVKDATSKTDTALQSELARLVKKKEIMNLRTGFYLILTPRYRNHRKLPLELYVEKLFNYLEKPYYIAFYSAAAFHGASHQKVQKDYLITQVPNIRDIKKGAIYLTLFATSKWPLKNLQRKKSDTGYFNISSPALTAIDLIHYQSRLGGLNRMLATIEELAEDISSVDVQHLLDWYPHVSTIQRFGYLLTKVSPDHKAITPLQDYLKGHRHFPVSLSPKKNYRAGKTGNPWKVDTNVELESDL